MTETPRGETPQRNGRDWFAPPAEQPTDITYAGSLPRPAPIAPPSVPIPGTLASPGDVRVWPPPEPEGEGEDRSTQPFPALRTNRQPPPAARPAPPAVPAPTAPAAPPADPVAPPPAAEAPPARKKRTGLLIGGTVLSVVLAVGAPTWFGYGVYQYGRPSDVVHVVQPGQAGVLQHVSWRVSVEKIKDPTGKPDTSDRQWLKVVATRTALDGEGAIRHGAPQITFTDRAGRTWQAEPMKDETPPDAKENKVGTPYRMELVGVVPRSAADEAEVLLRPSTYRDVPDQSAADAVDAAFSSTERADQVLRFRR
ncbi:hypothetical protein [Microbispora sp. H11081]|uniref:hypothetical protein n=1 Tax=Microbispora sp. H11081 TaxID=2729107 RepID=UPI0014745CD6|nr:hypothetical protein [Microbispora sp. H11081]